MGEWSSNYSSAIGVHRGQGELHYIGRVINLRSLRDFIVDSRISEGASILLHSEDWDQIRLDYRNSYQTAMPAPFKFLGVSMGLDLNATTPKNRIRLVRDHFGEGDGVLTEEEESELPPAYDMVYRCGWCGNIIGEDGRCIEGRERLSMIDSIEHPTYPAEVGHLTGECCRNKLG